MEIIEMNVKDLKPYEKNPRKNKDAVDKVANSIKEFGFKQPIVVDRDNVIVIGHTRLEAAKKLGYKTVPCILANDLTPEQIKAFRLADNKVAEFSVWDEDLLNFELSGISLDMSLFGFELDEEMTLGGVEETKPEVEFSEIIGEEHNYLVLFFDNDVDWIQAQTLFDIKPVKCGSTRKDGKISEKMERKGVGRVLNGAKALERITGGLL